MSEATRPRLLDLFCGAGGAAVGYHRAGFDVFGVDIKPQPNYPFTFRQLDITQVGKIEDRLWDAIHASPPCQAFSSMSSRWSNDHPDLIADTRALLEATDLPYVIENVPAAPLKNPITLCGSMFGLGVRRHRLFETNFDVEQPQCCHADQGPIVGVYGNPGGSSKRDGIKFGGVAEWRKAMDIDWMTAKELAQSIPPAYTEHIGRALLAGAMLYPDLSYNTA